MPCDRCCSLESGKNRTLSFRSFVAFFCFVLFLTGDAVEPRCAWAGGSDACCVAGRCWGSVDLNRLIGTVFCIAR